MENSDTFISLGASCRELGSVHITQEMGRNNGLTDIRQSALQRCYVEQDINFFAYAGVQCRDPPGSAGELSGDCSCNL